MAEIMVRYDDLRRYCEKRHCGSVPLEYIKQMSTIEAEPVIHCKDCAFWESKRVSCEGLARCRTGESGYRCRVGYDFCSRAQRREEVSEDAGSKTD